MIAPFSQFHVCSITVELIGGKTCRGHEITLYLQLMIEDGVVVNNKSHDEKRCYHCIKNYLPRSNLEYKIQRWIFHRKKKRSRRQNLNDTISLHFVTTMWILLRKISLFPSRLPPKPGSSNKDFLMTMVERQKKGVDATFGREDWLAVLDVTTEAIIYKSLTLSNYQQ